MNPAPSSNTVLGRWRATYTPGDWTVLAGPTSLVFLEPPGDAWSELLGSLWEGIVASASMAELADRLAAVPFATMPRLAAFFWTDDGMRSLVRGDLAVIDLERNAVIASGSGVQTWNEAGLEGVSQVQVDGTEPADPTAPVLPLVVGAVRAASIRLDASAEALIASPQGGGAVTAAIPADLPEDDLAGPGPLEEADEGWDTEDEDDLLDDEPDELDGEATEMMGDPFDEPDDEPAGLATDEEEGPDEEPPAGGGDDDGPGANEMENADTQLMAPPPLPPASAGTAPAPGGLMVVAVVCPYGHPSPPNATVCRVCGSPIAPQSPRPVAQPSLATLRGSDGNTASLDRPVLVGRAPSADRSGARDPRLMTVPSPGHDISRTHVEIAPDGWQVVVTDLNSTNGTVVVGAHGSVRTDLVAGQPTAVDLGSVLELGDGVSVLIDFPQ